MIHYFLDPVDWSHLPLGLAPSQSQSIHLSVKNNASAVLPDDDDDLTGDGEVDSASPHSNETDDKE